MKVQACGPMPAKIMLVGEAPGNAEIHAGKPFVGQSGQELSRMLHEAGIARTECYITNVCKYQPPGNRMAAWIDKRKAKPAETFSLINGHWVHPHVAEGLLELESEIKAVEPNLIIALGGTPLWALTGNDGITKWRGSLLELQYSDKRVKVIPTYHPTAILHQWSWRFIAMHDLRKCAKEAKFAELNLPEFDFIVRPSFETVMQELNAILVGADAMKHNPGNSPSRGDLKEEGKLHQSNEIVQPRPDLPDLSGDINDTQTQNAESIYNRPIAAPLNLPTAWKQTPLLLAADSETRYGYMTCLGIATSSRKALCIPFTEKSRPEGYWSLEEELAIILKLYEVFFHPMVGVIGQNFLYDDQYFAKLWGYVPHVVFDTMVAQGVLFPGLPKGLDFLSSMYCEGHVYWKDEGKEYDPKKHDEAQHWEYNCKDACRTFEVFLAQSKALELLKLQEPFNFKMAEFNPVLIMMLQGVKVDLSARATMDKELDGAMKERLAEIEYLFGHPVNPNSPKQMKLLVYKDFNVKEIKARKANAKGQRNATLDKEAIQLVKRREPLLIPFLELVEEYRSARVFSSTFVKALLDEDNRLRCYFNIIGTETMRFSSSKNAFGRGCNFQNIPKGDEEAEAGLALPNVRKIFVPDPGYIIFDADLAKADAQVVAWEAGDEALKQLFRESPDLLHKQNAIDIFGKNTPHTYAMAKRGVHLTNYLGTARTLAAALGITMKDAERFQRQWFGAHPAIPRWQEKIKHDLMTTRTIMNKFGYRRFYFGRLEEELKEAIAWIPQSTVACAINRGLLNIAQRLPEVDLLIQVHDSLVFQIREERVDELLPKVLKEMHIVVPYDDPLVIQVEAKSSKTSWGDCE